jgi:hypothetical protein
VPSYGLVADTLGYDITLDHYKPESAITEPVASQTITACTYLITGIAHDYFSGMAQVEVSTDGATWNVAQGTDTWTYEWNIPSDGSYSLKVRATDLAGNVETPGAAITVTVAGSCVAPTPTATEVQPTSTSVPPTSTLVPATPTVCVISFSDVPSGSTFYPFVQCLACRNILGGYSDGTFRPGNNITRGQLSKIVANAAGINDPATTQTFEDVTPDSTFYLWVERLAARGIMGGYECGGEGEPCGPNNLPYFRPGNNATRGQVSKIVSNTFFPDCQAAPR